MYGEYVPRIMLNLRSFEIALRIIERLILFAQYGSTWQCAVSNIAQFQYWTTGSGASSTMPTHT